MEFYLGRFCSLERKTYDLEVITPMFLGGANPRDAELRIPPIKGMLRFWWRALHPNLTDKDDYKNLSKEESKLFGDAGDVYGKSRVKIQFADDYNLNSERHNPLPHKKESFLFKGFDANQSFKITIDAPIEIHKLFEFSTIVGGLGKRSRRGFGSLAIKENSDSDLSPLDKLFDLIGKINSKSIYQKKSVNGNSSYVEISQNYSNVNYPYLKKIQIGEKKQDYNQILKTIGQSSHNNNSDYTGFIDNRGYRFSSPIYVNIVKHDSEYMPVISTLNTAFNPDRQNKGQDKSQSFINDILQIRKRGQSNDMAKA